MKITNKIKNNKKQAFTLAEMLITFILIAFLTTIMMFAMKSVVPDREAALFKKAYSVAERVVSELVADETLYPYDPNRAGFLNTDCVQIPGETTMVGVPSAGISCDATGGLRERIYSRNKFCQLFKNKVNVIANGSGAADEIQVTWVNPDVDVAVDTSIPACASAGGAIDAKTSVRNTANKNPNRRDNGNNIQNCIFQTSDGIVWLIEGLFSNTNREVRILVDVLPQNPDNEPLVLGVRADGKIELERGCAGVREREILSSEDVNTNRL